MLVKSGSRRYEMSFKDAYWLMCFELGTEKCLTDCDLRLCRDDDDKGDDFLGRASNIKDN
jgi:hypothetical protein